MTDEELISRLRSQIGDDVQQIYDHEALFRISADRIEALVKERDVAVKVARNEIGWRERAEARAAAIREAALKACTIIDAAVREGHDNLSDLVLHLLSAAEPARRALALIQKGTADDRA